MGQSLTKEREDSCILNKYEQIKATEGEAAAKAYMKDMRAKVKKPGLANVTKKEAAKVSKKGWETRRNNKQMTNRPPRTGAV